MDVFEGTYEPLEEGIPTVTSALVEQAMCLKRGIGCEQNFEEAIELLQKAIQEKDGEAARELALFYAYGTGVEQNDKKATDFFLEGAHLGDAESMYRLFQNLSVGIGCSQDLDEADKWLEKAANTGHVKAAETWKRFSGAGLLSSSLKQANTGHAKAASPLERLLGIGLLSNSPKISDPEGSFDATRSDSAESVRIDAISPSSRYSLTNLLKEGEKPVITSVEYVAPVPTAATGRLILIYTILGAVSGFLLRSVFEHDLSVMGSASLYNYFNSVETFTIYMVIEGAVIGFIMGRLLSKLMKKTNEGLVLYLPLLLLPVAILAPSSLIMTLLQGVKGLLTGILTIAMYIIFGFSILGSSSQ